MTWLTVHFVNPFFFFLLFRNMSLMWFPLRQVWEWEERNNTLSSLIIYFASFVVFFSGSLLILLYYNLLVSLFFFSNHSIVVLNIGKIEEWETKGEKKIYTGIMSSVYLLMLGWASFMNFSLLLFCTESILPFRTVEATQ